MKPDELREQIQTEFEQIEMVLVEIDHLLPVLRAPDCSARDKAAAAAFLSQCHMGIENILKRILIFCDVNRPSGHDSHIRLVKMFGTERTPQTATPLLFDNELLHELSGLRRSRH